MKWGDIKAQRRLENDPQSPPEQWGKDRHRAGQRLEETSEGGELFQPRHMHVLIHSGFSEPRPFLSLIAVPPEILGFPQQRKGLT